MNEEHKEQVDGLMDDTILEAMSDDFNYESKEEAQAALDYLKERVAALEVGMIY